MRLIGVGFRGTFVAGFIALVTPVIEAEGNRQGQPQISEVIVTGTLLPTAVSRFSSSLSVLTKTEIENANKLSLIDLLRDIEGVHITQPGGQGGVASLFLRGAEPNFTTVLVDGVKLNNPNNTRGGSFDFATLALSEIERVEVVRGPQSAIYGSDALSGVVNFVSRRDAETGGRVLAELGEGDFNRLSASGSLNLNAIHQLSGGLMTVDNDGAVPGDTFNSESIWLALSGGLIGSKTQYQFNVRGSKADKTAFPEDSGGPDFALLRQLDRSELDDVSVSLKLMQDWGGAWESQLLLSHYDRDDETVSPGVTAGMRDGVPPNDFDSNLKRSYLQFSNRLIQERFSLSVGGDFQREKGSATGVVEFSRGVNFPSGYNIDRDILGFYVVADYLINDNVQLLAGLRYDDPDSADSQFSPSLGMVATVLDGNTVIRANWSEGFKLPSFFALASPLVGNPQLKEEQVESFDISVSQQFNNQLDVSLTLFDSEYIDLIDFDSENFTNVNRARVDIAGVEASLDWQLSTATLLRAHATYTDIDVLPTGRLRQRPDWRAGVNVLHTLSDRIGLTSGALFIGDSFDSSIPTGDQELDGYARIDLSAWWRLSDVFKLAVAIDNLLDEDYFEAIGFFAPGRRLRFSVEYSF